MRLFGRLHIGRREPSIATLAAMGECGLFRHGEIALRTSSLQNMPEDFSGTEGATGCVELIETEEFREHMRIALRKGMNRKTFIKTLAYISLDLELPDEFLQESEKWWHFRCSIGPDWTMVYEHEYGSDNALLIDIVRNEAPKDVPRYMRYRKENMLDNIQMKSQEVA